MRLAFFEAQPQLINLKVPDIRLNKDFALYGKVGKATLSGPFLDALKELSDYTPGRIAISVRKNQMDVFPARPFLCHADYGPHSAFRKTSLPLTPCRSSIRLCIWRHFFK